MWEGFWVLWTTGFLKPWACLMALILGLGISLIPFFTSYIRVVCLCHSGQEGTALSSLSEAR